MIGCTLVERLRYVHERTTYKTLMVALSEVLI